jgi:hypothetical protein
MDANEHPLFKNRAAALKLPATDRIKGAVSAMMAGLDYFGLDDTEAAVAIVRIMQVTRYDKGQCKGWADGRAERMKRNLRCDQ